MKNPFFLLAAIALVATCAYALLHPSTESQAVLKEIAIGLIMGKFALAQPGNGTK